MTAMSTHNICFNNIYLFVTHVFVGITTSSCAHAHTPEQQTYLTDIKMLISFQAQLVSTQCALISIIKNCKSQSQLYYHNLVTELILKLQESGPMGPL